MLEINEFKLVLKTKKGLVVVLVMARDMRKKNFFESFSPVTYRTGGGCFKKIKEQNKKGKKKKK